MFTVLSFLLFYSSHHTKINALEFSQLLGKSHENIFKKIKKHFFALCVFDLEKM